ncbi:MAG: hypothetical protein ACW967_06660 [Candidatus Hodarchaeales archaeon]
MDELIVNKISIVFSFFLLLTGLIAILILSPFIIGIIFFGSIFGGIGLVVVGFHALMHKLQFCPLCGIFPFRQHKSTN